MSTSSPLKKRKKTRDVREVELEPRKSTSSSTSRIRSRSDVRERGDSREIMKKPKVEQNSLEWEDEQAVVRNPDNDCQIHMDVCQEIKRLLLELQDLRHQGTQSDDVEMEERKIEVSMMAIMLKKLNRLSQIRCRNARDSTAEEKHNVDSLHLQLQNLLYELTHLQKEINKCLQFKSADEDIDLVPVTEFYLEAPQEISRPTVTIEDKHQQYLARMEWEREQRRRLAEECKTLKKTKEETAKDIRKRQEQLDSLLPRLKAILSATQPVQEALGVPLDHFRQQEDMARYLPRPLYVLFVQADAYRDACDKLLAVTVDGVIEEAKSLQEDTRDSDEESGESDQEENPTEKRHKKSKLEKLAAKQKKLLQRHPLSVRLSVKTKDKAELCLNFFYCMHLHIVTVKSTLKLAPEVRSTCISGGSLLFKDTLLAYLFPEDHGEDTPNSSNHHQLSRLGMNEFSSYIRELGHPYAWAQRLGGLRYLDDIDPPSVSASVCSTHIAETVKSLRRRLQARLALQKQMSFFERGSVPVNPDVAVCFPTKIISRLTSWRASTYEDFLVHSFTAPAIELGVVAKHNMFYTAIIERNTAKLVAQIAINPDYPKQIPVIAVSIFWNFERTALNDENVKALELEVCKNYPRSKSQEQLLATQLETLLLGFDVYLEAECAASESSGPSEISKEKIFLRVFRGRSRLKPFKYSSDQGLYFHR